MISKNNIKLKLSRSASKDIIWSFFSTIVKIGGSLFILPLILIKFSTDELGLWYFFTSVGMFLMMLDVGFSATLARNFRYIISSKKIYKYDIDDTDKNNILNITTEEMLYVCKKIYYYLAIVSFVTLFLISFYIIKLIEQNQLDFFKSLLAWLVYSVSISLNLMYYYRGAVLNGLNKIELSQKIDITSLIVNYIFTAFFIFLNFGIISLAIGTILGLGIRIILYEYYIKLKKKKIGKEKLLKSLELIWPNTWRTGVCNILGYLIRYLPTFFITIFIGLEVLGSYGITFQIVILITSISTIWINTAYPKLNTLRIEIQYKEFKNLFYSRLKKGVLTYVLLSFFFLLLGRHFLNFIGAKTSILADSFIFFILLHMLIDFITNAYGYIIMTGNRVPFIKSSLINVVLIIFFNFIFNYFNFGLWGILIENFLGCILYNYWYWIFNGYVEVNSLIKKDE